MAPRRSVSLAVSGLLLAAVAIGGVNRWTSLGPDGLFGPLESRSVATSPGEVFVATARGVFRSDDQGAHWDHVLTTLGEQTWTVAVAPSDPELVYAGGSFSFFRSEDGGHSWTTSLIPGRILQVLAVDPVSPRTVWAGTADIGTGEGSVLRSADGGKTWTPATTGVLGGVTTLVIDPTNPDTVYAGSNASLLMATRDGGVHWSELDGFEIGTGGGTGGGVSIAIAVDPSDPSRIYTTWNPKVCPGLCTIPGRLRRSEDFGETWTTLEIPGQFLAGATVAPDSALTVSSGDGVYRSRDHGTTWIPLDPSKPLYAERLVLDPVDPSRLYAGTWQGLFTIQLDPDGPCAYPGTSLCLHDGRFEVTVTRRTSPTGPDLPAQAVPVTRESGYFWFFDPDNVEVMVKVLDGRLVNGHFWVFFGALSNVAYTVTVRDTETDETRVYENPAGVLASVADTSAFPVEDSPPPHPAKATGTWRREIGSPAIAPCHADSVTLCLNEGRFRVQATHQPSPLGPSIPSTAVPLTDDTGYFWFFQPNNVELVVKVVDGRPVNGHFWVFSGALSHVGYTITITDTETGEILTYTNPFGVLSSAANTTAF